MCRHTELTSNIESDKISVCRCYLTEKYNIQYNKLFIYRLTYQPKEEMKKYCILVIFEKIIKKILNLKNINFIIIHCKTYDKIYILSELILTYWVRIFLLIYIFIKYGDIQLTILNS